MDIKVDKKTVVVFDLDDTLYNELDYLISAYKEIARLIDNENEKQIFSIIFSLYRNNKNVFDFIEERYNIDKVELINKYRNHFPNIKTNKGVKRIFKKIKNKGGKIAIITDGRKITQQNKLKALNLIPFIDFVVTSEDIGFEKPSEVAFKKVMMKLPAEKYYYIADNLKKDFISPNLLKWKSVAVIDNGKNIHSNAFLHQDQDKIPQFYVYKINEIKIK